MNDEFDPKDLTDTGDLAEHDDLLGADTAGADEGDEDGVVEDDYEGETYE